MHVRIAATLVAALVLMLLPATSAVAYERVVDITFPLEQGTAYSYKDDYDQARTTGPAHRATDVLASHGERVHAAMGGTIGWAPGLDPEGAHATAGYGMQIRGDDGRLYAYYHLGRDGHPASEAFAPGLSRGDRVERGQLIGYVGSSGNASSPHLHFEIHQDDVFDPYHSSRLNPYSSLAAAELREDFPGAGRQEAEAEADSEVDQACEPTSDRPFCDVEGGAHRDDIHELAARGITDGCAQGMYCPDESIRRDHMARFLTRGFELAPQTPTFDDVTGTFAEDIGAIEAAGIAQGFKDGTYRPQTLVTRGQMAAYLTDALDLPDAGDQGLSDVNGSAYAEPINALVAASVANGYADGSFKPDRDVSRAEMASFVVRALTN